MNNVMNNFKRITIGQIFFISMALSLLVFSGASSTDSKAYRYVTEIEYKNMSMLLDLAKIKIVLSEVADLKIDLVSGKIDTVVAVIEKAERLLFFSSVASLIQSVLLEMSKSQVFPIAAIILIFVGVVFRMDNTKQLLILLLAISPGLTLYSIGMHRLSNSLEKQLDSSLHSKLKLIAEKTDDEKSKLLRAHEEALKKESNENSVEEFFSRVKTDVVYDVEKFFYDIKGDYEEIRALLNTGGANIIKELVVYIVHIILFFILSPLIYAYLIYRLMISGLMFGAKGEIKINQDLPVLADEPVRPREDKIKPTLKEGIHQKQNEKEKEKENGKKEDIDTPVIDKTADVASQHDALEKQSKETPPELNVTEPVVAPTASPVSNRAPLPVVKSKVSNKKTNDASINAVAKKISSNTDKASPDSAQSTNKRIGKGDGTRKKFM